MTSDVRVSFASLDFFDMRVFTNCTSWSCDANFGTGTTEGIEDIVTIQSSSFPARGTGQDLGLLER